MEKSPKVHVLGMESNIYGNFLDGVMNKSYGQSKKMFSKLAAEKYIWYHV